ncbi:MAG: phosphatase [Christensenellaceae bacterium]|nr:phosphatase [Christensenellaceae bacterium]
MIDLIADLHTHTLVSGHAYNTIREMAFSAQEKGLKILGISEHAPGIPGTVHPIYYANLYVVPREIYGVKLLHSCEINVLNDGTLSLEDKYINHLDYAIIGIHGLCYTDAGADGNTKNLIACMQNPKVAFISHPDDDNTPLNYKMLIEAAKKYDVALEINNSSFIKQHKRLNCVENYKTILGLCMEYNVNVVVSSDAHEASHLAEWNYAMELIKDMNFNEELILNNDIDKINKHILKASSYKL